MPYKNGTGPQGLGPLTGRGLGPCNFSGMYRQPGARRGLGRYCQGALPQTKTEQKQALTEYKQALKEELEDVEKEEAKLGL